MKIDGTTMVKRQTVSLVLHEACFLQAEAGRLRVEIEGQDDRHLEPFAMTILQSGACRVLFLDNISIGKVWPRSAKSVGAIQRLSEREFGSVVEIMSANSNSQN
jgi:hypothetical protein